MSYQNTVANHKQWQQVIAVIRLDGYQQEEEDGQVYQELQIGACAYLIFKPGSDTTPHRMGTSGIIYLGFIGGEHRAFQFRTGIGSLNQAWLASYRLSVVRHFGEYRRRNDMLLHGTLRQNRLD